MGSCYEDFFDFDDITLRVRRDKINYPIALIQQDPSLWFPIIPKVTQFARHDKDLLVDVNEKGGTQVEIPEYKYMLMQNQVRQEAVTADIIIKSHFFTVSDYSMWKRGYSIMEQSLGVTAIIINAITYNASNFTNDRTPSGILALSGGFANQIVVEKLKKILWAQMSGAANQHKIPIVGLPDKGGAEWVDFHRSAKDMEFYTGLSLFTSIVCALSGTNPNELGLASFHDAMKGQHLNEANPEGIWSKSEDNGRNTFINHFENTINTPNSDGISIFEEITGLPIIAEIKGIAEEDMTKKLEVNKKRLEVNASVNMINQEEGLESQEYLIGDTNIYDIAGICAPQINTLIRMDLQQKAAKEAAEQQAKLQGGEKQPPNEEDEMSDGDRQLIKKYGEPVAQ
jgi:hypothetical protein